MSPSTLGPFPGGRVLIGQAFARGIPEEVVPTMILSLSERTIKQYTYSLKKWWDFCVNTKIDSLTYSINHILKFLLKMLNDKMSYSSLNTYRSALSLIFNFNTQDEKIIKRFLKGAYNVNHSAPKYLYTWNPSTLLNMKIFH